jgi:predicted ATP-binding protein involved in virulence
VADAVSIKQTDIRQELQVVDGSPSIKYHTPVRISCEMQVGDEVYTWSRVRKDEASGARPAIEYPNKELRIADWFRTASNDLNTPLPVLNYQSIDRVANSKRSDFGSSAKQLNDRRCGYTGCLDSALDDKFIRKWCYAMMRKRDTSPRYDLFREAVRNVMARMDENNTTPDIDFSEEFGVDGDFVYAENGSALPISFLSAGYQSILWMVMDLAFRALQLNPGTRDLDDIFGIVLIDEVDKHLHPKWQWNVLNALHDTFPNVQFIITTHAPIVISSCKNAAIMSIESSQQAKPIEPVYGYDIQDVIQHTQGSKASLPELKELYVRFEDACIRKDLETAQRCFDTMNAEFPKSTERAKAQTRLRFLKLGG